MKRTTTPAAAFAALMLGVLLAACGPKEKVDEAAAAPPPAKVEEVHDVNVLEVERPDRFPVVKVGEVSTAPALDVTGSVAPDVSKSVPAISLASGRAIEVLVKLGDQVKKGQLLLRVQSNDISNAFNNYQSAVADEKLARSQLERAKALLEKGAIAQKDVDVFTDAEEKAAVAVRTTTETLRLLGVSTDHPSPIVDVFAPVSGVVIEQNVVGGGGVKTPDNSPNLFTIADLSTVWIVCDVYENNLADVQLGDMADVRLNAYPGKVYRARVVNIGPIMDPNIRTAKVRLEMPNPGNMRVGMFVTATFYGKTKQKVATVPSTAILHLRDKDWVFIPLGDGKFRKTEVVAGRMLPGGAQEVISGLTPGKQVASNALQLSTEAGQ
ncbi:MAG: efflux RND transporter periplasmic adaptor subunit [Bryobacteraceae bacterium]